VKKKEPTTRNRRIKELHLQKTTFFSKDLVAARNSTHSERKEKLLLFIGNREVAAKQQNTSN
jgi:hypothetical protein